MSEKRPETALQRMERIKLEREKAKERTGAGETLVGQLTHEEDGEPNFEELARKLEERKAQEAKGENEDYVKLTIYIRKDIAAGFNALITKRGQQKEFANQAFADFIVKKSKELDL